MISFYCKNINACEVCGHKIYKEANNFYICKNCWYELDTHKGDNYFYYFRKTYSNCLITIYNNWADHEISIALYLDDHDPNVLKFDLEIASIKDLACFADKLVKNYIFY